MGLLGTLDWVVIGAYFAAVFAVAAWSARQEKTRTTSAGYFLAGRNVGWFVVGAALYGLWKSPTPADWTITILTFGPPLVILVANAMQPGSAPLFPRHFYPFTPFYYIFLAMGWRRLGLGLRDAWRARMAAPDAQ